VTAFYLDASAFVKVVVEEPGSAALRRHLARRRARRVSSALLRAEALRAVRHLGPEARAAVRTALRRVDLVAVDDRILDAAGMLEPAILRTLDAVHLATALALGDDLLEILTYDGRMAEGARLLGLPVLAPA
jgi:predicted nucleic acid-binding protein